MVLRSCAITTRFCERVLILSSHLNRMVSFDHGEVFLPIIGSIGSGDNWVPLNPTEHITVGEVPQIINCGNAKVFLVCRASAKRTRINAQSVRIDCVIDADALGETLIAETALEHFGRRDGPGCVGAAGWHQAGGRGRRLDAPLEPLHDERRRQARTGILVRACPAWRVNRQMPTEREEQRGGRPFPGIWPPRRWERCAPLAQTS